MFYLLSKGDSLKYHRGYKFSTRDQDNDVFSSQSCSVKFKGAWWYRSCHHSNLNGLYLRGNHTSYADGVEWKYWTGVYYSLKFTEMKIRPFNVWTEWKLLCPLLWHILKLHRVHIKRCYWFFTITYKYARIFMIFDIQLWPASVALLVASLYTLPGYGDRRVWVRGPGWPNHCVRLYSGVAYALILYSLAGTEGSTVSALICDRWLILNSETLSISRCLNHW